MLETKSSLKLGPFKENVTKLQQRSSRKPMRPEVKNTWCHYPPRPAEDGRGSYWNLQTEEVGWRERCHPGASGELKKHRFPVWAWLSFCDPNSAGTQRALGCGPCGPASPRKAESKRDRKVTRGLAGPQQRFWVSPDC